MLYYPYFENHYKMIEKHLGKYHELYAHAKAMKQINFTGNPYQEGNTTFFILKEVKRTILDFSQGTVSVL